MSTSFPHLKELKNGDLAASAIKQVASGRFGVTPEYLVSAKQASFYFPVNIFFFRNFFIVLFIFSDTLEYLLTSSTIDNRPIRATLMIELLHCLDRAGVVVWGGGGVASRRKSKTQTRQAGSDIYSIITVVLS